MYNSLFPSGRELKMYRPIIQSEFKISGIIHFGIMKSPACGKRLILFLFFTTSQTQIIRIINKSIANDR